MNTLDFTKPIITIPKDTILFRGANFIDRAILDPLEAIIEPTAQTRGRFLTWDFKVAQQYGKDGGVWEFRVNRDIHLINLSSIEVLTDIKYRLFNPLHGTKTSEDTKLLKTLRSDLGILEDISLPKEPAAEELKRLHNVLNSGETKSNSNDIDEWDPLKVVLPLGLTNSKRQKHLLLEKISMSVDKKVITSKSDFGNRYSYYYLDYKMVLFLANVYGKRKNASKPGLDGFIAPRLTSVFYPTQGFHPELCIFGDTLMENYQTSKAAIVPQRYHITGSEMLNILWDPMSDNEYGGISIYDPTLFNSQKIKVIVLSTATYDERISEGFRMIHSAYINRYEIIPQVYILTFDEQQMFVDDILKLNEEDKNAISSRMSEYDEINYYYDPSNERPRMNTHAPLQLEIVSLNSVKFPEGIRRINPILLKRLVALRSSPFVKNTISTADVYSNYINYRYKLNEYLQDSYDNSYPNMPSFVNIHISEYICYGFIVRDNIPDTIRGYDLYKSGDQVEP